MKNNKNVLIFDSTGNIAHKKLFHSYDEASVWCKENNRTEDTVIRSLTKRNMLRKVCGIMQKDDITKDEKSSVVFILNEVIAMTKN